MNHVSEVQPPPQDLKRQIRQLESIAALSGGIAHDYNNLLTVIMGNISLALEHIEPKTKTTALLEQALIRFAGGKDSDAATDHLF